MSFQDRETSRNQGEPIQLYLFRVGPGTDSGFFYTDSEQSIDFDPGDGNGVKTFTPIAIDRGKIEAKGTLDRSRLDITVPEDSDISVFFKSGIPSFVVTCIIFNGHKNDPDGEFVAAWTGRIVGAKSSTGRATLSGLPVVSDIRRSGLRRNYQFGCTHALYDPNTCRANKETASLQVPVSEVISGRVVLPNGWNGSKPIAGFSNGAVFQWATPNGDLEIRTVRQIDGSGNVLTLNAAPKDLPAGSIATIIFGCNRQQSDCENLHNNIQNFGGCPYIPTESPLGVNNQFY